MMSRAKNKLADGPRIYLEQHMTISVYEWGHSLSVRCSSAVCAAKKHGRGGMAAS